MFTIFRICTVKTMTCFQSKERSFFRLLQSLIYFNRIKFKETPMYMWLRCISLLKTLTIIIYWRSVYTIIIMTIYVMKVSRIKSYSGGRRIQNIQKKRKALCSSLRKTVLKLTCERSFMNSSKWHDWSKVIERVSKKYHIHN